jgi:hypothetical protein
MPIEPTKLKAAGCNIGANLSQELLNRFSAAHFQHVPSIYSGSYVTDQPTGNLCPIPCACLR